MRHTEENITRPIQRQQKASRLLLAQKSRHFLLPLEIMGDRNNGDRNNGDKIMGTGCDSPT